MIIHMRELNNAVSVSIKQLTDFPDPVSDLNLVILHERRTKEVEMKG